MAPGPAGHGGAQLAALPRAGSRGQVITYNYLVFPKIRPSEWNSSEKVVGTFFRGLLVTVVTAMYSTAVL